MFVFCPLQLITQVWLLEHKEGVCARHSPAGLQQKTRSLRRRRRLLLRRTRVEGREEGGKRAARLFIVSAGFYKPVHTQSGRGGGGGRGAARSFEQTLLERKKDFLEISAVFSMKSNKQERREFTACREELRLNAHMVPVDRR